VRKGGQVSSEDLLPLGYGEWDRIKVRVNFSLIPLTLTLSLQGREKVVIKLNFLWLLTFLILQVLYWEE
jgi:hypothetical protein